MDEAAAIAIAGTLGRSRCAGELKLIGAFRVDQESTSDFLAARWREGVFAKLDLSYEDFMRIVARRLWRSRSTWHVNYLAFGPEFARGMVFASVSVDAESGLAVWHIDHPPPRQAEKFG